MNEIKFVYGTGELTRRIKQWNLEGWKVVSACKTDGSSFGRPEYLVVLEKI